MKVEGGQEGTKGSGDGLNIPMEFPAGKYYLYIVVLA